jgi:uncharacterized membrane protein YraQ (UPF0718 family)
MTDLTHPTQKPWRLFKRIDKAWLTVALILTLLAILDPSAWWSVFQFALSALLKTAPFILFAVLAVAFLKATGAESLLARAFEGQEWRMIVAAALLGGLSPFCSCEIIPFIAALLAVGAPLSAVMALWLSSPLMDPAMFLITAGTLGTEFAVAKTVSAVSLGIMGGFLTSALARGTTLLENPLRNAPIKSSCCGGNDPFAGKPVWTFWAEQDRRRTFIETGLENALFLLKWLALAYVIEALMVRYVPAEAIGSILGGTGLQPILLGAIIGGPAYLNGYAAVPLIDALLQQGMAPGAAMSFVIAGGVSSIPAAVAVWALVRARVFALYAGLGILGAIGAGLFWSLIA